MSSLRFTIITVIIIVALGGLAYAAILGMKAPVQYNKDMETVGDLRNYDDQAPVEDPAVPPAGTGEDVSPTETPTTSGTGTTDTPTVADENSLSSRLQAIKDSKVILKSGSKGPQVAALQEFLNLYNKTKLKVDSDFGPTLEKNIKAFQGANKLPTTGQVAEKTLTAMIDWLAKNPQ